VDVCFQSYPDHHPKAYDGGISEAPLGEAHSGFTFCALGALSFANRVPQGVKDHELLLRWLISRQVAIPDSQEDSESDDDMEAQPDILLANEHQSFLIGFNGRVSKLPDTCYTWWSGASLFVSFPIES
jgi:geranylgeranyl transferase type-1 subunit beta